MHLIADISRTKYYLNEAQTRDIATFAAIGAANKGALLLLDALPNCFRWLQCFSRDMLDLNSTTKLWDKPFIAQVYFSFAFGFCQKSKTRQLPGLASDMSTKVLTNRFDMAWNQGKLTFFV